jgi:hypothetical protein
VIGNPPAPLAENLREPGALEKVSRVISPKHWLNRYAAKALEGADTILGSIPVASVAVEIKEVCLAAIRK